ncbi:hypothetical protein GYA25_02740 [Candidatus Woesearchaeota archaeon]|nr:hypothetical protein [Candidatus Woesearchaeota archaeon]
MAKKEKTKKVLKKEKGKKKLNKKINIEEEKKAEETKIQERVLELKRENLEEDKSNKLNEIKESSASKNLLIILGFMLFCVLLFLGTYLLLGGSKSFTYKGILFSKYQYSKTLMLYSFPVVINLNNVHANYTFFLRKDPRKLKDNFNGTINLKKELTIRVDGDFNCKGDGIVAVSNIQQLYQRMNIQVYGDNNISCNDTSKNEVLLTIKQGDKTRLVQDKDNCYTIYVKDCEILEGTEEFIVETVAKLNEINKGLKVR